MQPSSPSVRSFLLLFPSGRSLAVLVAAVFFLLASVGLIEAPVLHHTHGSLLFPMDDAFVNLTVARNLAFYRVWGLSNYAFQSASSSLLYPVALAPVFFIVGAHLLVPLVVNFLAAAYFLLALQRLLIQKGVTATRQLLVLVGAMALTLLPLLVVSGMEYVLQLLFVFLFLVALEPALAAGSPPLPRRVYIYGALAVAARYEDILIVLLGCVLLGSLTGWKPAVRLALLSLTPVLLFGGISLAKGSYFLPNALLLGYYPVYALMLAVCALVAAALLLVRYRGSTQPRLSLVLLILLAFPFAARNLAGLSHFQRDCIRLYDQQFAVAGFVHLYYYKSAVGLNEPGAVSWFSEGRKLDFTGIASHDVTRSKKEHFWSSNYADSLSKKDGIRTAIVADPWFRADQLPHWDKVASWQIPGSSGAGKTFTFYAINKYDTAKLRKSLHDYQRLLPAGVEVRYY